MDLLMEADKRKALQAHMRALVEKLQVDIQSYERLVKPVSPDSALGRLTCLDAINSKSMNEAALQAAKTKLSKINKALDNIDDPDFGLCRACEEPIVYERLMAIPETTLCVACAQKLDA